MFTCFTRREIAFFALFLCVELTLLNFQRAAEEETVAPVVDKMFVFESHPGLSNNFCSIYRTDKLLTDWKRVGSSDEYANTDFLKGPTYRLPPRGNGTEFVQGTTVIVSRWAPYNPYEAMHAIFNYYMLTKRFRLSKPNIIFDDRWKDNMELKDRELYGAMSSAIIEGKLGDYTFENVVHMNKPSKCFLTAVPSFGNQGACRIDLYQEFADDLSQSLGLPRTKRLRPGPVKKVLWSSRRPYQRENMTKVHRAMPDEEFFLKSIQAALGSNYELISHDFGNYTWRESIKIAGTGNAMVGVHGAGLQWSAWLPRGAPLVEIFGGDRGPSNKHYRFLSKALGRPYTSCNAPIGHISWNEKLVDCIAKTIKSYY